MAPYIALLVLCDVVKHDFELGGPKSYLAPGLLPLSTQVAAVRTIRQRTLFSHTSAYIRTYGQGRRQMATRVDSHPSKINNHPSLATLGVLARRALARRPGKDQSTIKL